MDFFDERVLTALKDGKPRSFTTLLGEVGFSHNTLQQHLDRLVSRRLVVKEKMASNSLGRPKFAYHVPSTATKQVAAALQNPYETLVTLQFTRLRRSHMRTASLFSIILLLSILSSSFYVVLAAPIETHYARGRVK